MQVHLISYFGELSVMNTCTTNISLDVHCIHNKEEQLVDLGPHPVSLQRVNWLVAGAPIVRKIALKMVHRFYGGMDMLAFSMSL